MYPDLRAHPLDKLRQAGIPVTLNTDDPALMATDLVGEYAAAAAAYGWGRDVVVEIAHNGVEASFCDADLQQQLRVALDCAS
jgi:adenosine deaminase